MKGAPERPLKSPETASFLLLPHKTHWVADGASFPEEEVKGGEDDGGKEGFQTPTAFPSPLPFFKLKESRPDMQKKERESAMD